MSTRLFAPNLLWPLYSCCSRRRYLSPPSVSYLLHILLGNPHHSRSFIQPGHSGTTSPPTLFNSTRGDKAPWTATQRSTTTETRALFGNRAISDESLNIVSRLLFSGIQREANHNICSFPFQQPAVVSFAPGENAVSAVARLICRYHWPLHHVTRPGQQQLATKTTTIVKGRADLASDFRFCDECRTYQILVFQAHVPRASVNFSCSTLGRKTSVHQASSKTP